MSKERLITSAKFDELTKKILREWFNLMFAYSLRSISLLDIEDWKLNPTIKFVRIGGNLELVFSFSKKELAKIKKLKPDWNGNVRFPTYS